MQKRGWVVALCVKADETYYLMDNKSVIATDAEPYAKTMESSEVIFELSAVHKSNEE